VSALRLSVVVVSYGRPAALQRCLTAIHQLPLLNLEVIVVADQAGLNALAALPFADRIKQHLQAQPNISVARNIGAAAAAGDVIAFLDDDCVPSPSWAGNLLARFDADPELSAATGPVLGRNGISVQWGHIAVDRRGRDLGLSGPSTELPDGFARKLHGTNMAFRRAALRSLGGFDSAFSFFLDDTDVALRLHQAGLRSGWVPDAIVHHGFAASARRTEDRIPLSLYDIGLSTVVFLRKHADPAAIEAELAQLEHDQRNRLFRLARQRRLEPPAIRDLMESLSEGMADGKTAAFGVPGTFEKGVAFQPLRDTMPGPHTILSGWRIQATRLRQAAAQLIAEDRAVHLFLFEPTPRKHKVIFTERGIWEQHGGLYGPSIRRASRVQLWTRKSRLHSEVARIRAEIGSETRAT